jgi:hypothetical protein
MAARPDLRLGSRGSPEPEEKQKVEIEPKAA